jgi:hypothetical protein
MSPLDHLKQMRVASYQPDLNYRFYAYPYPFTRGFQSGGVRYDKPSSSSFCTH